MWAWLCTLNPSINGKPVQSLPRELSLPGDYILHIKPLRELESLHHEPVVMNDITVTTQPQSNSSMACHHITELNGDFFEIRATIARDQADRKQFGFIVFSNRKGGGLSIVIRSETSTLRVGNKEAQKRRIWEPDIK